LNPGAVKAAERYSGTAPVPSGLTNTAIVDPGRWRPFGDEPDIHEDSMARGVVWPGDAATPFLSREVENTVRRHPADPNIDQRRCVPFEEGHVLACAVGRNRDFNRQILERIGVVGEVRCRPRRV